VILLLKNAWKRYSYLKVQICSHMCFTGDLDILANCANLSETPFDCLHFWTGKADTAWFKNVNWTGGTISSVLTVGLSLKLWIINPTSLTTSTHEHQNYDWQVTMHYFRQYSHDSIDSFYLSHNLLDYRQLLRAHGVI